MFKALLLISLTLSAIHCAPTADGFYTLKQDWGMGFQYLWALKFEPSIQVPFNTSNVDLGTINFCVQTTGSQAVGPYSCKLNYMYDSANDQFHWMNGPCDIAISHQHTDMMISAMNYNKTADTVGMSFTSHAPIGGDYVLVKASAPVLTCGEATDVEPFVYCKKPAFFERMSVLIG